MMVFPRYTGSQAIINYIQIAWHEGKVSFLEEVDQTGIRRMIALFRGNFTENFGYLYMHEDDLSEAHIKAKSHYLWRFIKEKCELEKSRAHHEVDSSQGEPTSEVRRTTKTCSLRL